jgi:hypothetical protein
MFGPVELAGGACVAVGVGAGLAVAVDDVPDSVPCDPPLPCGSPLAEAEA